MDSHKEDTAGGLLAALVLHERPRILGSYYFRMAPLPLYYFEFWLTMAPSDVLHYIRKELLHSSLRIRYR
jgi:hypothetical protein